MIDRMLLVRADQRAKQEYRTPLKWQMDDRAWVTLLGDRELFRLAWLNPHEKTLIGLPVEILPNREHWNIIQLVTDRDGKKVAHGADGRPVSAKAEFSAARATFDVDRFEYKTLEPILVELPK